MYTLLSAEKTKVPPGPRITKEKWWPDLGMVGTIQIVTKLSFEKSVDLKILK